MDNYPLDCSIYCTRCTNIGTTYINNSQFHKMCDYCSSFYYKGVLDCFHCHSILFSLPESYLSCIVAAETLESTKNPADILILPTSEPPVDSNESFKDNIDYTSEISTKTNEPTEFNNESRLETITNVPEILTIINEPPVISKESLPDNIDCISEIPTATDQPPVISNESYSENIDYNLKIPKIINEPPVNNNESCSESINESDIANKKEIIDEEAGSIYKQTSDISKTCENSSSGPKINENLENKQVSSSNINRSEQIYQNKINENTAASSQSCTDFKQKVHHYTYKEKNLRYSSGIDSESFSNLYSLDKDCVQKNFERRHKAIVKCFLCQLDSIKYLVLNCKHFVCSECFTFDMEVSDFNCFSCSKDLDESICKFCFSKIDSNFEHKCRKKMMDDRYNCWNFKRLPAKNPDDYHQVSS